jgi:hypothetical protein
MEADAAEAALVGAAVDLAEPRADKAARAEEVVPVQASDDSAS